MCIYKTPAKRLKLNVGTNILLKVKMVQKFNLIKLFILTLETWKLVLLDD